MSNDNSIIPIFFLEPVHMAFRSEQEGRPIYEDREFVRLLIAGDKNSEMVREVTEADRDRFHEAYAKFKRGLKDEEQLVGTPLSQWPAMRPSDVKMFNSVNLFSVEQVGGMSDTAVQAFGMGGLEWRAKAKAYLSAAADGASAAAYAVENERLKADISELQRQVRDLAARIPNDDEDPVRRGPGRPRREAA